jgi:putative ABC transport system permease protein
VKLRWTLARLLALFRKQNLDRELDDEVLAYLELAERDAIAAGLTPEDARRAARRGFGGIEQMKEVHRDHRSILWIENLLRDFRYGLASLRRNPGFAAVAIGVLALGIGANTAMFSLVDAVLLKPLPFPQPERMVRVWESPPEGVNNVTNTLDFLDWKRMQTVFEALSVERTSSFTLTGEGEPVRLAGTFVSADYFQVFGVNALIGRTFTVGEDESGADPVVVLSHAAWQSRFGGDPGILNRELLLDGEPNRVVGILPPGSFDRDDSSLWKPLVFAASDRTRGSHWLCVVGRLRNGVSLAHAQEEMLAIDAAITEFSPDWKRDWTVAVEPFDRRLIGETFRQSIYIAIGAVLMVLLIACSNVANLLLAKGAARKKEMAVRASLGASRGRLIVQLLTESVVLCLLGGAAGIAVAHLLLRAATPLLAGSLPFTADVSLDLRVLGFAGGVALTVSLLVGLFPSFATSFATLSQSMNQSARGSSIAREGLRRTIVAVEVAVSLVLVCGALLLFKSLLNLQQVDTGVRTENVITMSVDLPLEAYPTPASAARFYQAVAEQIRAVPGIKQIAVSTDLPLQVIQEGEAVLTMARDAGLGVRYKRVDPQYFSALGIPMLSGRGITGPDRAGAPPVVVINEEMARQMADEFGFADPVGENVVLVTPYYVKKDADMIETEIVGIIRSERVGKPGAADDPAVYVPLAQVPSRDIRLIASTRSHAAAVMPGIREAVWQVDPNLALSDVTTLEQVREQGFSGTKQPAWLIGVFAAVAALLAALGLYGVLAHAVTQQRREIGIRMALGAQSRDVLSQVLRTALSMIAVGLVLGLAGAFALTRVMESLLFEVSALDPLALIVASILLSLIGVLAGLVPAGRAARVQPMSVLREDG